MSAAQVKALHLQIEEVLTVAVKSKADSALFPDSWLFHWRWIGKQASKMGDGKQIAFVTVGGRTSAFVPSVQKKITKKKKK